MSWRHSMRQAYSSPDFVALSLEGAGRRRRGHRVAIGRDMSTRCQLQRRGLFFFDKLCVHATTNITDEIFQRMATASPQRNMLFSSAAMALAVVIGR